MSYKIGITNKAINVSYTRSDGQEITRDIFKSGNMLYGLSGWQAASQDAVRNDFSGIFGDQAGTKYMDFMKEVESLSRSLQDDGSGGFIVPSDVMSNPTQPNGTIVIDGSNLPQTPIAPEAYLNTPGAPLGNLPGSTTGGTSGTSSGGGSGMSGGSSAQITEGQQAVNQATQQAVGNNQVAGWQSFFLGIQASRFQNEIDNQVNQLLANNLAGNAGDNLDSLLQSIGTGAINLGQYNQTQDRYSTADLRRKRNKVDYEATKTSDGTIPQGVSSRPTLIGI